MELPARIERIDLLEMENISLRREVMQAQISELARQLKKLAQKEQELKDQIGTKYQLGPGDNVIRESGMIERA